MFLNILTLLLFVVFTISALLLIIVILLQEGKGGGLAGAFGGMGGDAFSVGSGGINKVTATLAAIFVGSAIFLGAVQGSSVTDRGPDPATQQQPAGDLPADDLPDEE